MYSDSDSDSNFYFLSQLREREEVLMRLCQAVQRAFPRAMESSDRYGADVVRSEHLLLALLQVTEEEELEIKVKRRRGVPEGQGSSKVISNQENCGVFHQVLL